MKAVIAYLGSIKPLDVLEHACGAPLIIEACVLHVYPLEDWGHSHRIAREGRQGSIPIRVPFWGHFHGLWKTRSSRRSISFNNVK